MQKSIAKEYIYNKTLLYKPVLAFLLSVSIIAFISCSSPKKDPAKDPTETVDIPVKVPAKKIPKLYLISGSDGDSKNDVWSSSNGKDWKKEITTTPIFSARTDHQVVVFYDLMYLIGGYDNDAASKNDVWSSADGKDWTEVKKTGDKFSARLEHHLVVFPAK